MTPKDILAYEDEPKSIPLVRQHTGQMTALTKRLQQSDFWQRVARPRHLGGFDQDQPRDEQGAFDPKQSIITLGGPGSGNFGHAGRPGQVGGSGLPNVAGILAAIQEADGGFSYRVTSGRQPHVGYMVSIHKDREKILDTRSVNGVTLARYVRHNRDLIRQPGKYLGVWHNPVDGKVYLDIATRVMDPAVAERLGRQAQQQAYFDLVRGRSVRIHQSTKNHEAKTLETLALFDRSTDRQRSRPPHPTIDGEGADSQGDCGDAPDLRGAGGPGSGHFGHAGRPGEVGGSAAGTSGDPGRGDVLSPQSPRPTPNAIAQADADAYNTATGRPAIDHSQYYSVDIARAQSIAAAYDALPVDDSSNPDVAAAYSALGTEVAAQYAWATVHGMSFESWTKDGQPYATSQEMARDVADNRHLWFYTGGDPHPLLSVVDTTTGLTLNDKFRAIHDYYGHAAGGYSFGPRGEENAWATHVQMFSPLAARAMTTETRGQNSKVNFGTQNYNADGTYKNIPPAQRPFAVQKVALLPERFWSLRGAPRSLDFNPDQPRDEQGQWTDTGVSGGTPDTTTRRYDTPSATGTDTTPPSATDLTPAKTFRDHLESKGYTVLDPMQADPTIIKQLNLRDASAPLGPAALEGMDLALHDIETLAPALHDKLKTVPFVYGEYDPADAVATFGELGSRRLILINSGSDIHTSPDFTIATKLAEGQTGDAHTREMYRGILLHEIGHLTDSFTGNGMTPTLVNGLASRLGPPYERTLPTFLRKVSVYSAEGGPHEATAEVFTAVVRGYPLPKELDFMRDGITTLLKAKKAA